MQAVETLSRNASWRSGFRVGYHSGMAADQAAKHVRKVRLTCFSSLFLVDALFVSTALD